MDQIPACHQLTDTIGLDGQKPIQINIVQLELLQTGLDRLRNVRDIGDHFGRNKELIPSHATLFDGNTQFCFCVVHLGSIQVVIAQFDGQLDRLDQFTVDVVSSLSLEPRRASAISKLAIVSASVEALTLNSQLAWARHHSA